MQRKGARLGQHFLTGTWAASKLVESAEIHADDTVLEIGPGKGALTRKLLATGARVIAVEKDESLVSILHETFDAEIAEGALRIIASDIRDFTPHTAGLSAGEYILAANIPYYVTGEIIRQFLETDVQPHTIVILIQKEVAERIIARDRKESILSISVKAYGTPTIIAKVGKGNFSPPPSVDSAILKIERVSKSFFSHMNERFFFQVVRAGFSSKRKKLTSNLAVFGKERVASACVACGIAENARAEDVTLAQWQALTERLAMEE